MNPQFNSYIAAQVVASEERYRKLQEQVARERLMRENGLIPARRTSGGVRLRRHIGLALIRAGTRLQGVAAPISAPVSAPAPPGA